MPNKRNNSAALVARGLTVKDVAQRYRVSPEKVRGWIRHGELLAVNTAPTLCDKPRYVVTQESLARFEQLRQAAAAPAKPTPRRKRTPAGRRDFYPD